MTPRGLNRARFRRGRRPVPLALVATRRAVAALKGGQRALDGGNPESAVLHFSAASCYYSAAGIAALAAEQRRIEALLSADPSTWGGSKTRGVMGIPGYVLGSAEPVVWIE